VCEPRLESLSGWIDRGQSLDAVPDLGDRDPAPKQTGRMLALRPCPDLRVGCSACAAPRSRSYQGANLSQFDIAHRGANASVLKIQVSQRRPAQQHVQAWLSRCRSKTPISLGGTDHHRILAVQSYTLRPMFQSLSHDLAEMSLGVLKLPGRECVIRELRRLLAARGFTPPATSLACRPWSGVPRSSSHDAVHGLIKVRPQPSNPLISRVAISAPDVIAVAAICASNASMGALARRRVVTISA
jgi:hypothetical protein